MHKKMKKPLLIFTYYEDVWLDLDLIPVEKSDIFSVITPIIEKKIDLSKFKLYITFRDVKKIYVWHRIIHALKFYFMLPYLLINYKIFLFVSPPYFHFLSMPIIKCFNKRICTIAGDPYSEICKEVHWQAPKSRKIIRAILYPLYLFSEYAGIKMSHKVFAVTPYLYKKYTPWIKNLNLELARNGGPVEEISRIKPKKAVDCQYIYYVGGILKWRGIDLLINAFNVVKETYKAPLKLVIVGGDKEELSNYPELKELGKFEKDIIFKGRLSHSEALSFLKEAKIAVNPNRNTPMSRMISSAKVFEYISAEIPQVCTDSGEHADLVKKLQAGVVVEDNAESIAQGILQLLNNPKLYKKLKDNCRKRKNEIDYKTSRAPIKKEFENL